MMKEGYIIIILSLCLTKHNQCKTTNYTNVHLKSENAYNFDKNDSNISAN